MPGGTNTGGAAVTRDYVESCIVEDVPLRAARIRAAELGCVPVGPAAGATLRLLANAIEARAVVEIGTGTGVSGLWLLRGMREDGVLTTVDVEAEHLRAARRTFADAGMSPNRTRMINGAALQVLPRMADGVYDLVFCDAVKTEYADYLNEALRMLRPGGMVVFDNALWHDRVPDHSARDTDTVAIRELGRMVRDNDRLVSVLLNVGDGLLAAVHRP